MEINMTYSKNQQQGSITQTIDEQYAACLHNSRKRFKTLIGAQRHMKKNGYELQSNLESTHSKNFSVTCLNALHVPTEAELGLYRAQTYSYNNEAWHKEQIKLVTLDELIWLNHKNMPTRAVMLLDRDLNGRLLPEHCENDPLFVDLTRSE